MAVTLLTHRIDRDPSGLNSGAFDSRGASLIVLALGYYGPAGAFTVTDSAGNDANWVKLTTESASAGSFATVFVYCQAPITDAAHVIHLHESGDTLFCSLAVACFAGTALTGTAKDQEDGTNASGVLTLSGAGVTPTAAGELIVSCLTSYNTNDDVISIDAGFTKLDSTFFDQVGGARGVTLAYAVQPGATLIDPTWSWGGVNTATVAMRTASFFAAASPAGIGASNWSKFPKSFMRRSLP